MAEAAPVDALVSESLVSFLRSLRLSISFFTALDALGLQRGGPVRTLPLSPTTDGAAVIEALADALDRADAAGAVLSGARQAKALAARRISRFA